MNEWMVAKEGKCGKEARGRKKREIIASEAKRRKARLAEGASEESSFYGHTWDLTTKR